MVEGVQSLSVPLKDACVDSTVLRVVTGGGGGILRGGTYERSPGGTALGRINAHGTLS